MPRSLQRARRRRDVGRAQADAHQAFLPVDVLGAGRRLDQLQVELVARALEQRALGQHAEVLAARQHGEAEQRLVEIEPVGGAIGEDRLHHAEPVQARQAPAAWDRCLASGTKSTS